MGHASSLKNLKVIYPFASVGHFKHKNRFLEKI